MIKHECELCSSEPDECYCSKHLEQIRKEAYEEGFEEGKEYVRE